MAKVEELKVGQLVKHDYGFEGVVVSIDSPSDVTLKVVDIESAEEWIKDNYVVGDTYVALPSKVLVIADAHITVGSKVKHKEFGFTGVAVEKHFFPNNYVIKLDDASEHPHGYDDTFVASRWNLELVEETEVDTDTEDALKSFEALLDAMIKELQDELEAEGKEEVEVDTNNGTDETIEIDLGGMKTKFANFEQFIQFIEYMESKQA